MIRCYSLFYPIVTDETEMKAISGFMCAIKCVTQIYS